MICETLQNSKILFNYIIKLKAVTKLIDLNVSNLDINLSSLRLKYIHGSINTHTHAS